MEKGAESSNWERKARSSLQPAAGGEGIQAKANRGRNAIGSTAMTVVGKGSQNLEGHGDGGDASRRPGSGSALPGSCRTGQQQRWDVAAKGGA